MSRKIRFTTKEERQKELAQRIKKIVRYEVETTRKICSVREQNAKYGMIKNLGEGEKKAMDNEGLVSYQVAWVLG